MAALTELFRVAPFEADVFAARFSWLDRHASLAAKNRLLEAEIFAAVVLGFIILVAAGA
jgi:hypothetical protein